MVLGFNHNLIYKGETFHVQTEDSGVSNPHIITLLYRGGVIICSKKTGYSDILKMENLAVVVEELMKEQHKDMMRRLKSGEFDDKAFSIKAQLIENYEIPSPEPESAASGENSGVDSSQSSVKSDISMLFELTGQHSGQSTVPPPQSLKPEQPQKNTALDDAVLSFFGSNDK